MSAPVDVLTVIEDACVALAAAGDAKGSIALHRVREPLRKLIAAIPRALEMLRVAGEHSAKYGADETTIYDEADCDGTCVKDDCEFAADDLRAALAKAVP